MTLKFRITFLLAFSLLFGFKNTRASVLQLSDQAEVMVLILDPTQVELYSAFGHSAFRINDPLNRIDIVFNYGIFVNFS